jgi:hypothetical protein
MSLPQGFLTVCKCGLVIAKRDPREDEMCGCGLVWKGFRKDQASSVSTEKATLDKRVDD